MFQLALTTAILCCALQIGASPSRVCPRVQLQKAPVV
jgi:hypothetical protein